MPLSLAMVLLGLVIAPRTACLIHNGLSEEYLIVQKFSTSLVNIVRNLKWTQLIILYHGEYEKYLHDLTAAIHDGNCMITMILRRLPETGDDPLQIQKMLLQLHRENFPHFHIVLVTRFERAITFLEKVEEVDIQSRRTTDFRHSAYWIIACFSPCQPSSTIQPHIHQLENVLVVSSSHCIKGSKLTHTPELYTLNSDVGGRVFGRVSAYNTESGTSCKHILFPNTKYGFNNRRLTILTKKSNYIRLENGRPIGYLAIILNQLASQLNFSYSITDDNVGWGLKENGTWKGLVGKLVRREVDMVMTGLSISSDREQVIDFLLPPTIYTFLDVVYRLQDEQETVGWKLYINVFHPYVSAAVVLSLLTFTVLFVVLSMSAMPSDTRTDQKTRLKRMFGNLLQFIITKNLEHTPLTSSMRSLLCSWGLFSVVVTAAYAGNLAALLTAKKERAPFNSFRELVNQNEYKWGIQSQPGSMFIKLFSNSSDDNMKAAWRGMVKFNKTDPEVLSGDTFVHLRKVVGEKYAYLYNRHFLERYFSGDCNIRLLNEDILFNQIGVAVPQDYPLSKELEQVLSRMSESGMLQKAWKKTFNQADNICTQKTLHPRNLTDIRMAFYLLTLGIAVAAIQLAVELCHFNRIK